MFSKITLIIVCCLIFVGCSLNQENTLPIDFSSDSSAIVFNDLNEANLYRAQQMLLVGGSNIEQLLSVTKLSEADSSKEEAINGRLEVKSGAILFYPDTPFVKGQYYLIRTVLGSSFGKTSDILKTQLGHDLKVREKVLRR